MLLSVLVVGFVHFVTSDGQKVTTARLVDEMDETRRLVDEGVAAATDTAAAAAAAAAVAAATAALVALAAPAAAALAGARSLHIHRSWLSGAGEGAGVATATIATAATAAVATATTALGALATRRRTSGRGRGLLHTPRRLGHVHRRARRVRFALQLLLVKPTGLRGRAFRSLAARAAVAAVGAPPEGAPERRRPLVELLAQRVVGVVTLPPWHEPPSPEQPEGPVEPARGGVEVLGRILAVAAAEDGVRHGREQRLLDAEVARHLGQLVEEGLGARDVAATGIRGDDEDSALELDEAIRVEASQVDGGGRQALRVGRRY